MCMEKEFLAVESGFKDGLDGYEGFRQDQQKTSLTIKGIFESLDVWREERGLQRTVGNIAANIGEEIVEYLRAENDEQRVDALCDMFVFSVNAICAMDKFEYASLEINLCISNPSIVTFTYMGEIIFCFSRIAEFGYTRHVELLIRIVVCAKAQLEQLGYNFLIAMDETLKEIHSRTGAMNEVTGKWEKFKTEEAKALWYKADYSKAKR